MLKANLLKSMKNIPLIRDLHHQMLNQTLQEILAKVPEV